MLRPESKPIGAHELGCFLNKDMSSLPLELLAQLGVLKDKVNARLLWVKNFN